MDEHEARDLGLDQGREEDLEETGWWIGRRLWDWRRWTRGSGRIPMWIRWSVAAAEGGQKT